MGRKCSIPGCTTGYLKKSNDASEKPNPEKISIYSFPKKTDPELRQLWLSALPNTFNFNKDVTVYMGICSLHWTDDVPYVRRGSQLVPAVPPNNFKLQQDDELSTISFKQREKKLLEVREKYKDEIESWMATDKVRDFSSFCDEAKSYLVKEKWIFELDNTNEGKQFIRFYSLQKLTGTYDPINIFKFTVYSDMSVELISEISGKIPDRSLNWIFGNQESIPFLVYWSQFSTLLSQCSTGVWVDKNDHNHIYVNDLQELEDDNQSQLSFNPEPKDYGGASESNTGGLDLDDEEDGNGKRLEIIRLTEELFSVIFHRNQLMKKMQSLQDLANINLDMLSLIVNVYGNPENRVELAKVYKLIQVIMNENLEISETHTVCPVVTKEQQYLVANDIPLHKIPSTIALSSSEIQTNNAGQINQKNNAIQSLLATNHSQNEDQIYADGQEMNENINLNTDSSPHTENDDGNSLKQSFSCEQCEKTYSSKCSLNKHIAMKHTSGYPIECCVCGKEFGRLSELKHHMILHTDKAQYQCSVCGKTFKWSTSFRRHCKYAHTEDRPFHCSICSRGFKHTDALRCHERFHMIKKRRTNTHFTCKICGKIFVGSYRLKYHMANHSDERPFQCTRCGKSFKRKFQLVTHEKNIHGVEKPYKCPLCPRRFMLQSNLQSHEKCHMGNVTSVDGRFPCFLCNKTFQLKAHLRTHFIYVHLRERITGQTVH